MHVSLTTLYIIPYTDVDNTDDTTTDSLTRHSAIIIAGAVVLVAVLLCAAGIGGVVVWTKRRKIKLSDTNLKRMIGGHEKEGIKDGIIRVDGPAQFHNTDLKADNKVTQFTHCKITNIYNTRVIQYICGASLSEVTQIICRRHTNTLHT